MNRVLRKLCLAALLLGTLPVQASALGIGVGAFGGTSIPIIQDDTGAGAQFGIRVPVSVAPLFTVEPYFATSTGGDKDQDVNGVTYTRSGIDVTSFGANVLLTFGSAFQLAPYVGVGSNKLERDGLDATETGYTFGLGFKFGLPLAKLSLHARGGMNAVLEEGSSETSRKWVDATLGVSYDLFTFPVGQ
jgi:hypothetical protein